MDALVSGRVAGLDMSAARLSALQRSSVSHVRTANTASRCIRLQCTSASLNSAALGSSSSSSRNPLQQSSPASDAALAAAFVRLAANLQTAAPASVPEESKGLVACQATADVAGQPEGEAKSSTGIAAFTEKYPALTTGFFFFLWYFLNVIFNILNKKIYNYFPYPYFVSAIHLLVGVVYCLISWQLGVPKRAPIDKGLLLALAPVAFCHALGHVMSNVSFTAVAVSFTHTIKSLEPFFNAAASQFLLGQSVSLPLWLSLAPVVFGVCLASVTEVSFNWTGFLTAMTSNVAFTYRNVFSKKAMVGMDSTNLYAYISILSLIYCIPPAIILEGPKLLSSGFADAIAKVGLNKFVSDLFWVGMFYHLYNQLATNTLERVSPLTHAVGNVLKRVFVIGFSIIVFGNKISTQTGIGTVIAIAGVAIYSLLKAKEEEEKRKAKAASSKSA